MISSTDINIGPEYFTFVTYIGPWTKRESNLTTSLLKNVIYSDNRNWWSKCWNNSWKSHGVWKIPIPMRGNEIFKKIVICGERRRIIWLTRVCLLAYDAYDDWRLPQGEVPGWLRVYLTRVGKKTINLNIIYQIWDL